MSLEDVIGTAVRAILVVLIFWGFAHALTSAFGGVTEDVLAGLLVGFLLFRSMAPKP